METNDFLKVPEVAKICRVDARTVRKWIKEGKLLATQAVKGGQYLISRLDIPTFERSSK